jgi:hypothetical protein
MLQAMQQVEPLVMDLYGETQQTNLGWNGALLGVERADG